MEDRGLEEPAEGQEREASGVKTGEKAQHIGAERLSAPTWRPQLDESAKELPGRSSPDVRAHGPASRSLQSQDTWDTCACCAHCM